jgi:hypothetical protein
MSLHHRVNRLEGRKARVVANAACSVCASAAVNAHNAPTPVVFVVPPPRVIGDGTPPRPPTPPCVGCGRQLVLSIPPPREIAARPEDGVDGDAGSQGGARDAINRGSPA